MTEILEKDPNLIDPERAAESRFFDGQVPVSSGFEYLPLQHTAQQQDMNALAEILFCPPKPNWRETAAELTERMTKRLQSGECDLMMIMHPALGKGMPLEAMANANVFGFGVANTKALLDDYYTGIPGLTRLYIPGQNVMDFIPQTVVDSRKWRWPYLHTKIKTSSDRPVTTFSIDHFLETGEKLKRIPSTGSWYRVHLGISALHFTLPQQTPRSAHTSVIFGE